jgi:transcription elongation factor GreA
LKDHAVQKFPMTAPGLRRLEEELRTLRSQERPAVIRAIAEARSHGDLSENAEYHEARERQSFIEIVGVYEADIKAKLLSISSPLAKALIGKKVGETISVPAPGGDRSYEILEVRFV